MANPRATMGTKLGPRLGVLISQYIVWTQHKLAKLKHDVAMHVFHSISDEISSEAQLTLEPIIAQLHDMMDEDNPAYPAIHFLHTVHGQLSAIVGTGVQMSGLFGTVSSIVNNALAPYVYDIISASPGQLPDAPTIVQAFAAGLVGQAEAIGDIGSLGIQKGWAEYMLTLGQTWPAIADLQDMYRRQIITQDQFIQWAQYGGMNPEVVNAYFGTNDTPLSTADAALAVLRGDITSDAGLKIASENGTTADDFATMLLNTGEPPGTEQLLEAYRRGFIDKATLESGILQSRVRDQWIPTLEDLAYSPMSVADAINAVVQNQMTMDQGETYAQQNGLQTGDFAILYATAGSPLSRTEMEDLYNRGLVTEDQVTQALSESRLKNKYNDLAFALHNRLLDTSSIAAAMRVGALSQQDAVAAAMQLGYSQSDATIAINSGTNSRILEFKDRVVSAVIKLTEDGIMTQADAAPVITSMGYTTEESAFVLQAAQFNQEAKYLSSAVTAIRSKYLAHHITKAQAQGDLSALSIPSSNLDYLFSIWDEEWAASVAVPSGTDVAKAVAAGAITTDQGTQRLEELGYSAADAAIVIGSGG